ncbi:probable G-protein coupled receptor 139 isoform X1 [Narcine bancroftii]|uniref:probable G-protein coupled receptor 139 isoform X1 n=2 Tax=Narcine bancroftii TaxID=1343680 RepID=UPI003831C4DD
MINFSKINDPALLLTERLPIIVKMRAPLTVYPFSSLPPMLQTIMIYYPIVAVFGVLASVMSIVILSRGNCGLSRCVSRYLVAMATADLLVVFLDVILYRVNDYYFPTTFLFITQVCACQITLIHAATDISVWLTLAFTFDRYVMICCHKLRTKVCSEITARKVITIVFPLFVCKNIPWFFLLEPMFTVSKTDWFCVFRSQAWTHPGWILFTWIHRVLTPLFPMLMISLLNALTVARIVAATRARKVLRGSNNYADENDSEVKSRRKSIILLFAVSGNFILLWMTYLIFFLWMQITHFVMTSAKDPMLIADQTSYMLLLLSCCTNTCIYAATQSKFREELINVMKYPVKILLKCLIGGK